MDSIIPSEEDIELLLSSAASSAFDRHVSFNEKLDISTPEISFDDCKRLWYDQEELRSFQVDVQESVSLLKKGEHLKEEPIQSPGLEQWLDLEGSEFRRSITIGCTLQAQGKGMSDEQIANLAQRCTECSKQVALIQGLLDYCDAYEPKMSALVPKVQKANPELCPKKRRLSPVQSFVSRVKTRRRLEQSAF